MPGVHWSRRAKAKLETINPAIQDQLTSNAGKILHKMPPALFPHDEGFEGEVMWHRGIPCGELPPEFLAQGDNDGPWDYFLFYTQWRPEPEGSEPDEYFEVLDICGLAEVAARWNGTYLGL